MKPTVLAAALAAGLAALSTAPAAHADCARAQVAILPATGATLPPRPTIYAFVPDLYQDSGEVLVHGRPADIERVGRSAAFEVLRIRIHADVPGEEVTVSWRRRGATAHYEPDPWVTYRIGEPAPNRARVAGVSHAQSEWTCSNTEAIRFEFQGNALAYSVAWDDGTTNIIPADLAAMHSYRDPPGLVTWTDLGKPNCMQPTTDMAELARPRAFTLSALFADGSQLRVGRAVAQLGKLGVRLPIELVGAEAATRDYERSPFDDAADAADELHRLDLRPLLLGALGGALAFLGAGLLYALVRSLARRHREHEPRS